MLLKGSHQGRFPQKLAVIAHPVAQEAGADNQQWSAIGHLNGRNGRYPGYWGRKMESWSWKKGVV